MYDIPQDNINSTQTIFKNIFNLKNSDNETPEDFIDS